MRRVRLCKILLIITVVFLLIQLVFLTHKTLEGKGQELSHTEKKNLKDISYKNIKDFLRTTEHHGISVFLVDPAILGRIMSNVTKRGRCLYLCSNQDVTSFGVLNEAWVETGLLLKQMRSMNFQVIETKGHDPRLLSLGAMATDMVKTHCIFHRSSHFIHLVIFYERPGPYWWHAQVQLQDRVPIAFAGITGRLIYGKKTPGAFDKLEVLSVKIDGLTVNAPRYPTILLDQLPHSVYTECNHTRAQHFHSKYGKDDSVEAKAFWRAARDILKKTKKTLDDLHVRFWISSGTCLGWFRQCDLIPYSKDVDIGIWIKDYDPRLIQALTRNDLPLVHLFGKESDSFELSFRGDDIKLDIFFFYEEPDHMWNGGTQARTGNKYKYIFPKFQLCWTEFLEMKVRVPCPTLPYVEANYGKNWFIPVKHWDWKKSPPNVRENGRWPESERETVIKLYD